METAANFNGTLSSLHLYDGRMFGVNMSKCLFFNTNSSVRVNEKIDCVLHMMQLSIIRDSVSTEDSSLAVACKCYAYGHTYNLSLSSYSLGYSKL